MGRLTLVQLAYNGSQFENNAAETVLDALIRQGVDVSYSCKNGFFHSCMLRAEDGEIPQNAQQGLRSSHCDEGFFLPCVCHPISDMALAPPGLNGEFRTAEVVSINPLNSSICRVSLRPEIELRHRAGQFINFRRADGLMRSYSLCNQPDNEILELHVKRMPGGELSNWIIDELQPGAKISIQGPNGGFYLPENAIDKPILFIGPGSGLGALAAVVLDALGRGFTAPMRLYHGTSAGKGLYLRSAMANLAEANSNFRYVPCVSGIDVPKFCRQGRANDIALDNYPDLRGWRVFLCGTAGMVHDSKKRAYLAGASLDDIFLDPYEHREAPAPQHNELSMSRGLRDGKAGPFHKPSDRFGP